MQHVLVAFQYEKSSSYSILIFVISLFGCSPALNALGRRPICPLSLHATGRRILHLSFVCTNFIKIGVGSPA